MGSIDYIKVKGKIGTESVEFIVDTGATYSVIPKSLADKLQLKEIGKIDLNTGAGIINLPMAEAYIEVKNKGKSTLVAIAGDDKPAILGMKYLAAAGFIIDPATHELKVLDSSTLWKQKIAIYLSIIVVAIAIPISLKLALPHLTGLDTSMVMTFFVLLAGCLYELFNPWVTKFMEYRKLLGECMEKSETPPSIEEYFSHGFKFNKMYAVTQTINFGLALGFSAYFLYSGAVIYPNWMSNVVVNFGYAVGQSRILKERIFK